VPPPLVLVVITETSEAFRYKFTCGSFVVGGIISEEECCNNGYPRKDSSAYKLTP